MWLQNKIAGFYKCDFGFPVRNLVENPDPDQPLTPIQGEVLVDGNWIEGRWSNGGRVLGLQYDIRWCLREIDDSEYKSLISPQYEQEPQLELFN